MIRRLFSVFGAAAIAAALAAPSHAGALGDAPAAAASQAAETLSAETRDAGQPAAVAETETSPDDESASTLGMAMRPPEPTEAPEPQDEAPAAEASAPKQASGLDPEAAVTAAERGSAENGAAAREPNVAAPSEAPSPERPAAPAIESAEAQALLNALQSLPAGTSDEERNERAALFSFYEGRSYAPLWLVSEAGFNAKAIAIAGEIKRARDFGLDPRDFPLPAGLYAAAAAVLPPEDRGGDELKISLAVLKYGRYARGGRIINPSEQLSSYLDRRPQFLKPQAILEGMASAEKADVYLRGLNPKHPQFEMLRQKYLDLVAHKKAQSAEAKRLLANMEEWRWMPDDLGDVYVWNNIPDFTQRVMTEGKLAMKEAIVVGQIGKETPIFSRPLRKITFKPTWIVPDSIKVREILPNLISGGGSLMRQWDLEVMKDGQRVNWRKINWAGTDIRTYDVIQPHGSKSVMGKAKFSFPSQHTVFMHDAAEGEKWMLRAPKRTYSHGCMRVENPVGLAEILLREDKGWDAAKVKESLTTGGDNNEIPIDHKIMVHMTYFTALVDGDGKLHTFPDVYGHERRITLALEGKWSQIEKGRDHLAPVELNEANVRPRHRNYADENYSEAPRSRVVYSYPNPQRYAAPAQTYAAPAPASSYPTYNYRSSWLESLFGSRQPQYQYAPGARY